MKKILVCLFLLVCLFPSLARAEIRPWSDDEKILLFWSCLASVADQYTTCRALSNDNNWEINPMLGRRPSNEKVVIYLSVSQIVTVLVTHFWPDMRIPLLTGKATINTTFAIHNHNLIETGRGF